MADDEESLKKAERRRRRQEKKKSAKPAGEADLSAAEKKRARKAKRKARRQQKKEKGGDQATTLTEPVDEAAFPMQRLSDDLPSVFASIESIDLSDFPRGRFAVDCEGVEFHAYFEHSDYKQLFVLLGGAVPEKKRGAAHFERRGWGMLVPGSILCIADPTLSLSENLSLGWYIGTKDRNYTVHMAELVDRVATELGLVRSDIVFYASSGGGFAALMCARLLPGSNCIVVNPQIQISKHDKQEKQRFARAFGGDSHFKPIAEEHGERVSVLTAFPDANSLPPTVYVQNRHDTHHFTEHYEVFCETYAAPKEGGISANGRILTLLFEHHGGHGPEPRQIVRPLVAQALAFFDRFRKTKK